MHTEIYNLHLMMGDIANQQNLNFIIHHTNYIQWFVKGFINPISNFGSCHIEITITRPSLHAKH